MKKVPKQVGALCFFPILLVIFCLSGCKQDAANGIASNSVSTPPRFASAKEILAWMDHPTDDYIALVAHRGDWRNAPRKFYPGDQKLLENGGRNCGDRCAHE